MSDPAARARRVRFALWTRGGRLPAWQARCLDHLRAVPGVELALVVEGGGAEPRRRPVPAASLAPVPLAPLVADAGPGGREPVRCAATERDRIERAGLDFALCFEEPDAAGTAPPGLPVWSFRVGDTGGPLAHACLRELARGRPIVGAVLVEVCAGRAEILHRGWVRAVGHAPARTLDRVLLAAAAWPARACREWLRDGRPVAAGEAVAPRAPRAAPLRAGEIARLGLRAAGAALRRVGRELAEEEKWSVGVVERPVHTFLEGGPCRDVRWIRVASRRFAYTDPFALGGSDPEIVLAERFDYRTGRGSICAFGADGRGPERVVLAPPFHLSYPFLLRFGGEVYCVPESCAARRVELHRADPFPEHWTRAAVLLDGVAAVDATVFEHAGRWWMLCGDRDDQEDAKLFGFHAPSPLGPWTPHPLNPLKCDPRSARPAGPPFVHEGRLYRPAQDCARAYGAAVAISRVTALDPDSFSEEVVARVEPDPDGPCPDGLHTLCPLGERTLVDGKRVVASPSRAWRAVRRRLWPRRGSG